LIRKPSVAGYFYPDRTEELEDKVREMVCLEGKKEKAICLISPHAGFEYSGSVAGAAFSSVYLPNKFIILGPSHRSVQSRYAIMKKGIWETPLGDVMIDTVLAESVMSHCNFIVEDNSAHINEHSIEVQLPFIQFFKKDISFVPLNIGYYTSYEELEELGDAISQVIKQTKEEVMIVASTDMSHYVSQKVAKKKDFLAIDRILDLDAKGLYDVVNFEDISMCGFQPVTTALVASKKAGASKAVLVKYQTSGDVTGNYDEVVGYAGIRIG